MQRINEHEEIIADLIWQTEGAWKSLIHYSIANSGITELADVKDSLYEILSSYIHAFEAH